MKKRSLLEDQYLSASVSKGQQYFGKKSLMNIDDVNWATVTIPLSQEAKAIVKGKDYSGAWASLATLGFILFFWIAFVTSWLPINNLFAFFMCNLVLAFLCCIGIEKTFSEKVDWELQVSVVQYFSVFLIGLLLLDLFFDVYFLAHFLKVDSIYTALTISMTGVIIILIVNCIVLLSVAGKRVKTSSAVKYTFPAVILTASIIMLIFLITSLVSILPDIAQMENVLQEASLSASSMIYEGLFGTYEKISGILYSGQYGGAEMFTAVFEVLFYSNTTGFMLAIMVIGTFANIFVINQTRSSALQSATTLTVVGIPMIMIISMFLGVIAPPSAFVRIFGAEAIASFVFTFAMLSVYIIFLSMLMVFTHAAEVFNPEDEG